MNIISKVWRWCFRVGWQIQTRLYFTALRWLRRFPAPQQDGAPSSGRSIFLTFDDGPSQYTEKLLDVLAQYNVKATFFATTGANHLDILPKIAVAGHSIGNHTTNHDYKTLYASEVSFLDAVREMEQIILDQTGSRSTLFRFPGGSASIDHHAPQKGMAHRLTALVQDHGYRYFDWDLDSRDTADAKTPGAVYRNVISGVRGRTKTVVLQHDIKKFSVDAVEAIIVWGLKNGYTFLPLGADSPVFTIGSSDAIVL